MSDKEDITYILQQRIIDIILDSPLNIQSIPDDVERKMYEAIFDAIDEVIVNENVCAKLSRCFRRKK